MKGLEIFLSETKPLDSLKILLDRQDKGRGQIFIIANTGTGNNVELKLNSNFALSPTLIGEISSIPGIDQVNEI